MTRFLAFIFCLVALPVFAGEIIPATIKTKNGILNISLEVAATPDAREVGLSKRNNIGEADGMIFVFSKANDYEFWMKDTKIPLDMLFVEPNKHKIAFIAADTVPFSLTPIGAKQKIQAVIELDAGRAASDGIAVGDVVNYEIPKTIRVY